MGALAVVLLILGLDRARDTCQRVRGIVYELAQHNENAPIATRTRVLMMISQSSWLGANGKPRDSKQHTENRVRCGQVNYVPKPFGAACVLHRLL